MTEQATTLTSAAAVRGPLAMEAISVSKDFRIGRHQTLHAVRDVSFNLYQGAVVALVGESGSGKSTAARLLAGQERLTSGVIKLDGKQVQVTSRSDFRRYKSRVQLVFQDPFSSLNPVHTVRYHIERPVKLHQGKSVKVDDEVAALMEQVRLTPAKHFLDKYPYELSGGQRQRVSFARALAAHPKVLLADEPVSMLDVSIRLEMLNLLDDLRKRFRLAMLYITHDIASAPDPDNLGSTLRSSTYRSSIHRDTTPRQGSHAPKHPQAATSVGCPFSPRCPFADDRCRQEDPPLMQISATRGAACWRLDVAAPELVSGLAEGGRTTAN